jgi:hypothetical protein
MVVEMNQTGSSAGIVERVNGQFVDGANDKILPTRIIKIRQG